jgi:hypothetical protein
MRLPRRVHWPLPGDKLKVGMAKADIELPRNRHHAKGGFMRDKRELVLASAVYSGVFGDVDFFTTNEVETELRRKGNMRMINKSKRKQLRRERIAIEMNTLDVKRQKLELEYKLMEIRKSRLKLSDDEDDSDDMMIGSNTRIDGGYYREAKDTWHADPAHHGTEEIPPPPPKKSMLDRARNL